MSEPNARAYLESRLWPNGPRCPQCAGSALTVRPNGFYRCNPCGKFTFSVREGTIFGRSKIPLHKWIYTMHLVITSHNGISSPQLAKEIEVTQKTAWFILQRLREACSRIDMNKFRETVPKALDALIDVVLAYKPKPKTKAQCKRAKEKEDNPK